MIRDAEFAIGIIYLAVSAGFVGSTEFKALVGSNPTNRQLVTSLYSNVLGRTPDTAGLDFWVSVLDNKLTDEAGVLADMSESAEHKSGTAALIANGIEYVPLTKVAANTVPGAPALASISAASGSATLTLTAPASNGGSAITGYSASCAAATRAAFSICAGVASGWPKAMLAATVFENKKLS